MYCSTCMGFLPSRVLNSAACHGVLWWFCINSSTTPYTGFLAWKVLCRGLLLCTLRALLSSLRSTMAASRASCSSVSCAMLGPSRWPSSTLW
jgi:hypothetical protein